MTQPRWLALAWRDLGVAETPGADHTARVVRYYADVGHAQIKDDETAWCAAFLGSCLERAGLTSTRSLMARSYLAWGQPLAEFRPGAVAVLSRTADPALGHAGFLIGETADSIILLGGNQNDAVTVEAFPRTRLLGMRWPSSVPADAAPPVVPEGASSDALFDRALAHVLEMEGGWTEDPYDPGGPTNFGITLATYARDKGITLSTVLPAFGPLLGLDVTAELVRQLGDQIVVIVQAVGGLIGTILTIWGRARATTTLERKQITMNM